MLHKSTINFLKKLKKNNNRDWFNANKQFYEDAKYDFEIFIFELIQKISEFDESISGVDPKKCMFRIYRDVRFSKNKAPYKSYFAADIQEGGRKSSSAGYYIHIDPNEFFLGSGIYMPIPDQLLAIRSKIAVDYRSLKKIIENKDFKKYFKALWQEDKLKTSPKGFDKDHPAMEYLKLKSFIAGHTVKEEKALSKNFADYAAKIFKAIKPLNDFLNKV